MTTPVSDLHQQIMNLPCKLDPILPGDRVGYKIGHRDARHAAAQLVAASSAAPTVPLADYQALQRLVTSQGIRLMDAEDAASPAAAAGVPTDAQDVQRVLGYLREGEAEIRSEKRNFVWADTMARASDLIRNLAASPVAPVGAPTEKEIEILVAEHLRAETGADSIGRTCAWVTGVQGFARALLSYPGAPQSSVPSPSPRSSLCAIEGSELRREPSGEPSGEQSINGTEAAAVPLHNLKRQNMTTITHQLTDGSIGSDIASEHYFVGGDGIYGAARKAGDESVQAFPAALDSITFCVLVLHDGSTVTGESVCTNPENFDADREKKIARDCAAAKMVAP